MEERKLAYARAGAYLQSVLFTSRLEQEEGQKAASAALARLRRMVASAPKPPTVFARFTTPGISGLDLFYSPLRLLAAAGEEGLAKDIRVIQPLPIRRRGDSCIERWTIVGSMQLITDNMRDGAGEAMKTMLAANKLPWLSEIVSDDDRLVSFFSGVDPQLLDSTPGEGTQVPLRAPDNRADGLLVVAHHDDKGGFYFTPTGKAVRLANATRKFREGSAVILAACATANVGSADRFVKLFNRNKVDGIVVSPFLVDASSMRPCCRTKSSESSIAPTLPATPRRWWKSCKPLARTLRKTVRSDVSNLAGEAADGVLSLAAAGEASGPAPAIPPSLATEVPAEEFDTFMRLQGLEYVVAGNPQLRLCRLHAEESPQ